ncbi:MAG: DISARM system phospholipase D-like protein DrmC [Pseudomonadota bacterium]
MNPLRQLSRESMRALAAALSGGALRPPFAASAVARLLGGGELLAPVTGELVRLHEVGMGAEGIATLLTLLAEERDAASDAADRVKLVWTGPESSPRDRDTYVVASWLFRTFKSELLVSSFALGHARSLLEVLARRMDEEPALRVKFFVNVHRGPGDTTDADDLVRRFAHDFRTRIWPGERLPEVWYDPRSLELDPEKRAVLHAKVIVADGEWAFVTSANLTEAGHQRNVEAGVLVRDGRLAGLVTLRLNTSAKRSFRRVW